MPKKKINLLVSRLYTNRLGNSYELYDLRSVMAEVDLTCMIALHRDLSHKNEWVISHIPTGLKVQGGLDRTTAHISFYFLKRPEVVRLFQKVKSRRRLPKALRNVMKELDWSER